nr:MAG TPA: hypothetical protein [Caudoviricetes sp.]
MYVHIASNICNLKCIFLGNVIYVLSYMSNTYVYHKNFIHKFYPIVLNDCIVDWIFNCFQTYNRLCT